MNARETIKQIAKQPEIRPWQHGAIFLFSCAVIISRRMDAVFSAQFRIEDGRVFFADAYNLGWRSALFHPYMGYLHVFPRLGASLALMVPLSFAPLVLNIIAIAAQALPANLLLSSRSSAWGSLRFRAMMAGLYLALPNCWDIDANITSSQWLLALSAFLLLVAARPHSTGGRCFDLCILSLSSLSGPFCIFLLPIALFLAWKHRDRWRWAEGSVLAAGTFVQAWSLSNGGFANRPHYTLGASPAMFARLLSGQVFFGTLFGGIPQPPHVGPEYLIVSIGIAVVPIVLVTICLLRACLPMKLFLLFCTILLVISLISPMLGAVTGGTAWEALARGDGARYWFFPTLAFAWTILWCFQSRTPALTTVSAVLLCVISSGIAFRWRHPAYKDMHFTKYVRTFESAPTGTSVTIPENPEGEYLTLVKH